MRVLFLLASWTATGFLSQTSSHTLVFPRNVWLLYNPELPSRFWSNMLGFQYHRYTIRNLDKKPLIAHARLLFALCIQYQLLTRNLYYAYNTNHSRAIATKIPTHARTHIVANLHKHMSWLTCKNILNKICCGWHAGTHSTRVVVADMHVHKSWLPCTNILNKSFRGWHARTHVVANLHKLVLWLKCTNIRRG